jgi:hypothetical protein
MDTRVKPAYDTALFHNVSSRLYAGRKANKRLRTSSSCTKLGPVAGQPVFRRINGRPFLEFISSSECIGFHKKTIIGPLQSSFIPAKGRNHELHMARHQGSEARAA